MGDKGAESPTSSGPSPEEDRAIDQDDSSPEDSEMPSQRGESASGDGQGKPSVPMQKRRRVTRACDECRRKKIKCDGKQPCTHCTVYSYGSFVPIENAEHRRITDHVRRMYL